jgi:membrane protein DedA with SNARE-associated domain
MSLELISLETIEEFARTYGYSAVLLGILLENLGLPLPGESIVVVGGFLAGRGDLNYWGVLACSVSGAIAGNTVGYWIGVYGGWPLIQRICQLFRINEEKLLDIKHRFSINAARAVFFGRFITLLRVFAGPLAGIAEMPFRSFMFYNVLGALVWAGAIVTAAFFAGHVIALEQLMQWAAQFSFIVLGAIAAWFTVPYGFKWLRKHWLKPIEKSETI